MHGNFVCKFYCLDAGGGHKAWDFEGEGHIESSPCIDGGKVFFGAGDDGVHALDAVTGKPLWHFHGDFHVDASPAVAGGRLYAGSGISRRNHRTEAFCLDAETGRPLWRVPTDLPAWASPAVGGADVFVALGNGRLSESASPPEAPRGALLRLDSQTGRQAWSFDVPDGVHALDVAVTDGAGNTTEHRYEVTVVNQPNVDVPVPTPPTSPGPAAVSTMRFGPSPCILSASCLMFSTMSVTSSRTPGMLLNSCSTPSICTALTAAP